MSNATYARPRRLVSLFLLLALLLTLLPSAAFAAESPAEKPVYDAASNTYQISKPEHLMYLSGTWKEGAPRDGHYLLMNDIDMEGFTGFLPIASQKAEGFTGIFDGQFHAIRNLRVEYTKKYAGLFGYVGNEDEQAYIKNLALLDVYVTGQQNVGGIVGVNYGTITGCVVTGDVICLDLSNAHTSGGIAGKLKEGEGPIIGHIEDCFVFANVSAPYDAGGIAGMQDGGGYLARCFAAGTVDAYATSGTLGHAGGIAGAFNAGEVLKDSVSAHKSIAGPINADKIVGQLDDEAATNITGNISWEGTLLLGNEPVEQPIVWEDVSAQTLQSAETYAELGWDMDTVWTWYAEKNIPVLRGFNAAEVFDIDIDYSYEGTRIISRAVNRITLGEATEITASVISTDTVDSVTLYYGTATEAVTTAVPMQVNAAGLYSAAVPTNTAGYLYYYIDVVTDKETVTKPYDHTIPIELYIDDGRILGDPIQITITPDTKQGGLRFNWLTDPAVSDTVIEYRPASSGTWLRATGTSYTDAVTPGWKVKASHRVEITDLVPNTEYVYCVGDGGEFMSPEHTFTSPLAEDEDFSFIYYADPQSESVENYMSFRQSMEAALKILPNPAFMLSGGDTTQNGYKSTEWEALFEVMEEYYAKYPMATVAGNHEMKGDWNFVSFSLRFNMSGGGTGYPEFDRTMGWFEYGDAVFVLLNGEVTPPEEKEAIMRKELEWAKSIYDASDKKWRVMMTHAGPYTSNHDPLEVRDYYINDSEYSIDAMGVDLFLNGHDHIYIRSTVKNDIKVNTGDGTTYITGGTVGNKYYEYIPSRSDYSTDFYTDEEDKQIFLIFDFTADTITGTAYQKADTESFEVFNPIDSFEIRNNLAEGKKITDYTDVSPSDWFYEAAQYVVENQLIAGAQPYVFEANNYLTRAEVASAVYNLAGQPKTELSSFDDVSIGHFNRTAIGWVSATGIMGGTGNNLFKPDELITREEVAAIIARYLEYTGADVDVSGGSLTAFTDAQAISSWAEDAILICTQAGIMQGKLNGRFAPEDNATRAEISTMLANLQNAS